MLSCLQSDSAQVAETKTAHYLRMAIFLVATALCLVAVAADRPRRGAWVFFGVFSAFLLYSELREWRD